MFRQTITIAGAFLGIWLIGVMALAFVPRTDADARNGRTPVYVVDTSVWSAYQDPSGKFTIHLRTPLRYERAAESIIGL